MTARRLPIELRACAAICLIFAFPAIAQERGILVPLAPFDRVERYETNSGGAGTVHGPLNENAFSQPAANLSFAERADFNIGNALFRRLWVTAPSSTSASDGLGPLYNSRACQSCHLRDGRGHPPTANFPEDNAESMLMRLSVPPSTDAQNALLEEGRISSIPEPVYGGQLQDLAIVNQLAEGHIHTEWNEIPVALNGGEIAWLRRPTYSIDDPAYGPLSSNVMMSVRVAPPMIGLGLLEAIPHERILALADADDDNADGISGRPNFVWSDETGAPMLGRFGWKANEPTLNQQNAHAFAGDIGLSTPLSPLPWGDCTEAQSDCRQAFHGDGGTGSGLEIPAELMEPLAFYTRHLAVPARRNINDPSVLAGRASFYEIGCTACHVSRHLTADDASTEALSHQLIWPYTDLLLHDMGTGLADNRPDALASGREWRTPPLWGIGLTETVSGHTQFLHDGRARNLTEAILWHGGEAATQRDTFIAMPPDARAALLDFLNSL